MLQPDAWTGVWNFDPSPGIVLPVTRFAKEPEPRSDLFGIPVSLSLPLPLPCPPFPSGQVQRSSWRKPGKPSDWIQPSRRGSEKVHAHPMHSDRAIRNFLTLLAYAWPAPR
jgi:hypothetical protein